MSNARPDPEYTLTPNILGSLSLSWKLLLLPYSQSVLSSSREH
jgi:hypothetical protein